MEIAKRGSLPLSDYVFSCEEPVMVSIIVATYNHQGFIAQAIDSFLTQQVDFRVEILINDDFSTDKTAQIVTDYEKRYPSIFRNSYQAENQYSQGKKPWFHVLLPNARGKYVAICEGDDYWIDVDKLQKQVYFLEKNEKHIACFTNAKILNDFDQTEKKFISDDILVQGDVSPEQIFEIGGRIYPTASILFRNGILNFDMVNRYSEIAGDELLILILASKGKIFFLNEETCVYRRWSQGVYSSIAKNRHKLLINKEREYTGYRRLLNEFEPNSRKLLKKKMSSTALWICRYTNSFGLILKYLPSLSITQALMLLKHKIRRAI